MDRIGLFLGALHRRTGDTAEKPGGKRPALVKLMDIAECLEKALLDDIFCHLLVACDQECRPDSNHLIVSDQPLQALDVSSLQAAYCVNVVHATPETYQIIRSLYIAVEWKKGWVLIDYFT
jgi:hypothetical protein